VEPGDPGAPATQEGRRGRWRRQGPSSRRRTTFPPTRTGGHARSPGAKTSESPFHRGRQSGGVRL